MRKVSKITAVTLIFASAVLIFLFTFFSFHRTPLPIDFIVISLPVIFFLLSALYLFRKAEEGLKNILLLYSTLLAVIFILEFLLSFFRESALEAEKPVWVPYEYEMKSYLVDQVHIEKAKENKYLFNDINHEENKPDSSLFRIAVLGDSFIWGSGVEDSVRWPARLEKKLNRYKKTEILYWGKPGWSTKDQFRFLKEEGKKYRFDLLLITFVINDPHMKGALPIRLIEAKSITGKYWYHYSAAVFPNLASFLKCYINRLYAISAGSAYQTWLEDVWSDKNITVYRNLLREIKGFLEARNLDYLVIFTPSNHDELIGQYMEKGEILFREAGLNYINLYPPLKEKFDGVSTRKLWGNPADPHPGFPVTEFISDSAASYIADLFPWF